MAHHHYGTIFVALAILETPMKNIILFTLLLFSAVPALAQTQKWAVGLEVGEPNAVSIRKYGDRNALDISIGTYIGLFKSKDNYKVSNDDLGSVGIMFNATYLWYTHFLNDRMTAYAGPGFQVNSRRYYPNKNVKSVYTTNISTGPSVTVGLEFFFAEKPTSLFVEGGGYLELIPKFFYLNPNLSIGLRHNF
ncbi:porin family protein [Dyadobacter sp. CY326]|uniref:porin family protein n=1 Tax=Dyadobacter sp. CY326 TaxID=2907300 RepID=UPI001F25C54B|nr:porin family protein [Dyadobacter sp. CY326]MCE7063685.1 porin family protein [Dyadobacter sp. CY326]